MKMITIIRKLNPQKNKIISYFSQIFTGITC